ncbi:SDR family NAD(P)-dependent oxidoreductase [uncultured Jatrophihabitans sp.]|uniref:SDR family NAD(P)-dependent oxidoreductase n=1 Tax=uncultured Jatrophihabitans sp. TaxID=1610747 RepID=UPI0035CAC441
MPNLLTDKVAIVTGAGGGIGSAIAARLAQAGAVLSLVDRNFASTAEWGGHASTASVVALVEAAGSQAIVAEGDAADRSVAAAVAEQTLAKFGAIDILVNCAGGVVTAADRSFASTSPDEDLDTVFRANYRSTVTFSQSVLGVMRQQGSGAIVNITSGLGHLSSRDGALSHYFASKAAVSSYTTSLAQEVGSFGVRVNAVLPGLILTPRVAAQAPDRGAVRPEQLQRISLRRYGQPDDIAKVVEFFASDLASYVTGQVLAVNGG